MNLKAIIDFLTKNLPQILGFLKIQAVKEVSKPETPVEVTITPDKQVSFKLTRKEFRSDGIFSELTNQDGKIVAHTLEHSYANLPKVPNGIFKCVRGPHRLHNMTQDFITFEIMGVVGHDNILFHWGNYNKDSEGCVLVGESVVESQKIKMVTNSKATFAKFMASLEGFDEFVLTVE